MSWRKKFSRFCAACALAGLLTSGASAQEPAGPLAAPPDPNELKTSLPVEIIQVTGNRLVPNADINSITSEYQGRKLSFAEMEEITKRIEQLYRERGFFLVNAILPTQESTRGVLEIHVLEGKIENIVVEGNKRYPADFLTARFRNAVPGEGARTTDFQKALFLLNELPDVKVKAVLSAGNEAGGTEDEEETPLQLQATTQFGCTDKTL